MNNILSTDSILYCAYSLVRENLQILIIGTLFFTSCSKEVEKNNIPSWKEGWNTSYTEVRRTFESGVIFNDFGYQLRPEWRFKILSDTTVSIFSPELGRYEKAHIQFDHDSIYNFAWSWLRLRKLSKDSILFQVIKVRDNIVLRKKSNIYMTLYSDDYIKNTLKKEISDLVKPTRNDSIFIMNRIETANIDTSEAFPAHEQATLTSTDSRVKIKRILNFENEDGDYLTTPEYDITIKNAFKPFNYSFSAVITHKGKLLFRRSRIFMMPEFEERLKRTMRGIVNGYLSAYLEVKPGKTWGLPHSTIIFMNVKGDR